MISLIFDTETSDRVNFKAPAISDLQPHLLQLGAELVDGQLTRASVALIIAPGPQVQIPDEVVGVHGLSREVVDRYGVPPVVAVGLFHNLTKLADRLVCHNTIFDLAVMEAAYHRVGRHEVFGEVRAMPWACTMRSSVEICKVPPFRYGSYKWPSLEEAYKILVDKDGFEGAHDALGDVRATKAILFKLEDMGIELVK
jgi:DNA polymerase III subunit epsilon